MDDHLLFRHSVRMQRAFLGAVGYLSSPHHLLLGRYQNSVGLFLHGRHNGCLDPILAIVSCEYSLPETIVIVLMLIYQGVEASVTASTKVSTLRRFSHGSSVSGKILLAVLLYLIGFQCHCSRRCTSGFLHTASYKLI